MSLPLSFKTITLLFSKPRFFSSLGKPSFYDFQRTPVIIPKHGDENTYLAFCGIGNPNRFKNYLLEHLSDIELFRSFEDHHHYSQEDIDELEFYAKQNGINTLITTEKDMVKIRDFNFTLPIITVIPQLDIDNEFDAFIIESINRLFTE